MRYAAKRLLWLGKEAGYEWPKAVHDDACRQTTTLRQFRHAFAKVSREKRDASVLFYAQVVGMGPEWSKQFFKKMHDRLARSLLYTYQPPRDQPLHSLSAERSATVEDVADRLARDPVLMRNLKDFRRCMHEVGNLLQAKHCAMSAELCPETWRDEGVVQVHLHVAFLAPGSVMCVFDQALLAWRDIEPHSTPPPHATGHGRSMRALWASYFYCVVRKRGWIWSESDRDAFTGFPVQTSWVMALLQGRKIDATYARELVAQCAIGSNRCFDDIRRWEDGENRRKTAEYRARVAVLLAAEQGRFRHLPEVSEWEQQYSRVLPRYRFLILDGPSRTGKTMYARHLCPPDQHTLELNCSGGQEPLLREFSFSSHGLILFDEVGPAQVARQRKLFQAPDCPVQLGASATNCHAYEVFVHGIRMVCCSNVWRRELSQLCADDQDWIAANSVYVRVAAPLWEGPAV